MRVQQQRKCKKRKFRDEISAKLALADIQWKDNSKRASDEQRIYWHAQCKAYHLTSKPLARRVSNA